MEKCRLTLLLAVDLYSIWKPRIVHCCTPVTMHSSAESELQTKSSNPADSTDSIDSTQLNSTRSVMLKTVAIDPTKLLYLYWIALCHMKGTVYYSSR
jgi:hypothetical protein